MPIMSPDQADALLAQGLISPESHAAIVGPIGPPAPMASVMPAPEPPPPAIAPVEAAPPAPPPSGLEAIYGGIKGAVDALPPAGATPPPNGQLIPAAPPPAPTGAVDVGPIAFNPPAPAPPKVGGGASSVDPRLAALKRDEGFAGEREASITRQGLAEQERANTALSLTESSVQAQKDQATLDAKARADEAQAIDKAASEKRAAVEDYANSKVDSKHYWSSQSGLQKAIGLVSVALGQIGEGLSGGRLKNNVLDAIYRGQDQDIKEQEANIAKKGVVAQQKGTLYSDMLQLTGSKEAARSAAKVAQLQDLQRQIDIGEKKYAATVSPEHANSLRLEVQQRLSDEKARLQTTLRNESAAGAAAARKQAEERDKELFHRGEVTTKLAQDQDKINLDRDRVRLEGDKAHKEKTTGQAALREELNAADMAWKNVVETNPDNRFTAWGGRLLDTDSNSLNQGSTSSLISFVKKPGDSSEGDAVRLATMTPRPGDDTKTLDKKYALLRATIYQKHAEAAEKRELQSVPTTAPPGGKK